MATVPDILSIENALISVLREITGLNVASYMGQMDDVGQGDAVSFPAAWPLYGGEKLEYVDGPNYRRVQTWQVVVAAQSYGGGYDPLTRSGSGAYWIIESVLSKLANWIDSDLAAQGAKPEGVSRIKLNRKEAYYLIPFEIAFDQTFTWEGETMTSGTLGFNKVSATDANSTVTFTTANGSTTGISIYNSSSANPIYVAINGVATTASVEIPAGSTLKLEDFAATSLGIICGTGLTATVYVYATYR